MSPRRLREAVDRYFEECMAADSFPDLAGMRIALGLSELEMQRCMSDEYPNAEEYRAVFDSFRNILMTVTLVASDCYKDISGFSIA